MKLLQQPNTWFILGIITAVVAGTLLLAHDNKDTDTHPVGYADNADEVHVHSDWVLHIAGNTYDLSADKYQSNSAQVLHEHIHLHDNNDDVIHRHDHGVTLAAFFRSLGFEISDSCITNDAGETFCADEVNELMVFVNDTRIKSFVDYVNEEEDRILVYYGDPTDAAKIQTLLMSVTDLACIYSGTCPERGTPPPESCGITCEI